MTTCDGENGRLSPPKSDRKCPASKGATEERASNVVRLPIRKKTTRPPSEDDWPPGAA